MNLKDIASQLEKAEWNQTNFNKLVEYCQMSSALTLRHPVLIQLKWLKKDETEEVKSYLPVK